MPTIIKFIGFLAGALTLISFIPQVIKSWKTKRTGDLSLTMYACMIIGLCLWLVYGILLKDTPIIAANGVTIIFALSIFFLKIKYG